MYQIFIYLLDNLHLFLHFFFPFMENLFKKHPIRWSIGPRVGGVWEVSAYMLHVL